MKIMNCPLNGPRNITEFVWFGDVKTGPDPLDCSDEAWADHLFLEDNVAGEVLEWWLHAPTNFWFIARRDTLTDTVLETLTADAYRDRFGAPGHADAEAGAAGSTGGEA